MSEEREPRRSDFLQNIKDADEIARERNRREQELFAERLKAKPKPTEVVQEEDEQHAPGLLDREERPIRKKKVLIVDDEPESELVPIPTFIFESEPILATSPELSPEEEQPAAGTAEKPLMASEHPAILTDSYPKDKESGFDERFRRDVRRAIRQTGIKLD